MATKFKQFRALLAVVVATLVVGGTVFMASPALASGSCDHCVTVPATQTVVTTTDSSSTSVSRTHIRVQKKTIKQVKQYERVHHVRVAIHRRKNGVKSLRGCIDPVRRGLIRPGDVFSNTDRYIRRFWDHWQSGLRICNPHKVHWRGGTWLQGTKSNCGNVKIRIRIRGHKPPKRIKTVVTFRTVKKFKKVYDRWVKKTNRKHSKRTTTQTVVYSCSSGWTLEGAMCRKCTVQQCQPVVPPNQPPTGQLMPPKHIIVGDTQPVCVDNVSDPDGDQVTLVFKFVDTNGNLVGSKIGDVWQQPGGAWCQNFKASGTPQQVTVFVTLTDNAIARGAASNASITLSDNIPITPDQF